MSDRPTGVTGIAILNALGGIGLLVTGWSFSFLVSWLSIAFLAVALLEIVVSIGMFVGSTWAWYFAFIGWILNIISGIALTLLGFPIAIFSVSLSIFFIFYFLQENVKEFFEV